MSFKIASVNPCLPGYCIGTRPVQSGDPDDNSKLVYDEVAGIWKYRPVIDTLTAAERDEITDPKTGQSIFNSTDGVPNFYDGEQWITSHTISYTPIFSNVVNINAFNLIGADFQVYGDMVKVSHCYDIRTVSSGGNLTSFTATNPPSPFDPVTLDERCLGIVTVTDQDHDKQNVGIIFNNSSNTTFQWNSTISEHSHVNCIYQYHWK